MRVVHIIAGLNDGGAEATLFRLCTSDRRANHTVVSLMDEGKYGALLSQHGIDLYCLGFERGSISIKGVISLWRTLRTLRPDVVQTWMYHADLIGGVVARASGARHIFWGIRHTTLVPGKSRRSTIWVARLNARLAGLVPTGIVCCADSAVQSHVDLGYPRKKMHVIPNGYDLSQLKPDSAAGGALRKRLGIAEGVALIGMVARFDPQKDHANCLKALRILKNNGKLFRCALVGQGMTTGNTELVQLLDTHCLRDEVLLLGPQADIVSIMNGLDVHVLSSAFGEAFPNVVAEAMACGTPCVVTAVGDAATIVGETGWVVPPNQPDALAKALDEALDELEYSERWSARCQAARSRIIDHFSIDSMVVAFHEYWSKSASGVH